MIAKIVTFRMQKVIPIAIVVNVAQSGFIPKRQILDNVFFNLRAHKRVREEKYIPNVYDKN